VSGVCAYPVGGLPEITVGADLAALIVDHADLRDDDVVVVTSKVVSKAEGRVVRSSRPQAVAEQAVRVLARRGDTVIARTRHGITLAAAGVDASNTPAGTVVLLPADPDESARRLRAALMRRTGHRVAVLVSDTAGRAWRAGQTDLAVGAAGLRPLLDLTGSSDSHGNRLEVTTPAVADEVAALADLVMGKADAVPVAVVRGLDRLLTDEDGPGAAALVRPDADDMFGLGSLEAVHAAVRRDDRSALAVLRHEQVDLADLVRAAAAEQVALRTREVTAGWEVSGADDLATAAALERAVILATTTQWRVVEDGRNQGRGWIVLRSGEART
jgi:coenzyme F420-0:L-glutamate ligase / coenzyme F420-1:gamma-L-glutamate ligase